MKYENTTLQSWTRPLSTTEEERVKNTIGMINDALRKSSALNKYQIEVFVQGSYGNNTNVRQNSDVDVCVMLTSFFFCNYVCGKSDTDYGHTTSSEIRFSDYKTYVINAIKQKFGSKSITVKNKSINITSNSYHVNADVVPSFQYRDYGIIHSTNPNLYIEGIKFYAIDGTEIINYPKAHIQNGKEKNKDTNYFYKKIVRIMKHIRNDMLHKNIIDGDKITSFLIECLVWNIPNEIIISSDTWEERIKNSIIFLWNNLNDNTCSDWREVSKHIYLFHNTRKWSKQDAQSFLENMYTYLEY